MQTTQTKTQTLFQQGYRVRAGQNTNELIVRNPAGARYIVNLVNGTCTCPATKPCKHMKQMQQLITEQWAQILPDATQASYVSYEDHMYRLMLRWEEIQAAMRAAAARRFQAANLLAEAVREVEEDRYFAAAYLEAQAA